MQFVTETVRSKAVVDGAEVVTKVVTQKVIAPAIVNNHPVLALVGVFLVSKKVGEVVRRTSISYR